MHLALLLFFAAVSPPVLAFLFATVLLWAICFGVPFARKAYRNRARLALKVFRRTGWLWLLYMAPVSGGLPGTAIGTTLNIGYPGTYSENGDCIIKSRPVTTGDSVAPLFGDAVFLVQSATGGTFSSVEALETGGVITPVMTQGANGAFAGIAVREIITSTSYTNQGSSAVNGYAVGLPCDVIERGAVIVQYSNPKSDTLPVAGGKVYLRLSTNGAGTAVGAFESADDSGHMLLLTNCYWTTGVLDANNAIQITITTRNTP